MRRWIGQRTDDLLQVPERLWSVMAEQQRDRVWFCVVDVDEVDRDVVDRRAELRDRVDRVLLGVLVEVGLPVFDELAQVVVVRFVVLVGVGVFW